VVACGAVKSPQLLLLSGIGPADDLRAHHLPVVVDAPAVGAGLQDHPMVVAGWRTPGTRNLWEDATPENLERWRRERRGPMASFGAEAGGFTRSSILVGAVHVRSRGRVTLASPDPAARPLVDPAYFAAEDDLEVLVAGVRIAREIAAREPLASITDGELMPGADVDDDRVRDWIRATAGTMFHPTGTCAMGGAAESVCDPELRVRGVAGLRVVDASVMPATRGATPTPPPSPWPSAPPG
jgi:choline dehydrogenase